MNLGDEELVFRAWGSNPANFQFLTAHHQASPHDSNGYIDSLLANPRNLAFHVIVARRAEVVGLVKVNVDGHRAQIGATQNLASIRALKKAGFTREGLLRRWVVYPSQGTQAQDHFSYVL